MNNYNIKPENYQISSQYNIDYTSLNIKEETVDALEIKIEQLSDIQTYVQKSPLFSGKQKDALITLINNEMVRAIRESKDIFSPVEKEEECDPHLLTVKSSYLSECFDLVQADDSFTSNETLVDLILCEIHHIEEKLLAYHKILEESANPQKIINNITYFDEEIESPIDESDKESISHKDTNNINYFDEKIESLIDEFDKESISHKDTNNINYSSEKVESSIDEFDKESISHKDTNNVNYSSDHECTIPENDPFDGDEICRVICEVVSCLLGTDKFSETDLFLLIVAMTYQSPNYIEVILLQLQSKPATEYEELLKSLEVMANFESLDNSNLVKMQEDISCKIKFDSDYQIATLLRCSEVAKHEGLFDAIQLDTFMNLIQFRINSLEKQSERAHQNRTAIGSFLGKILQYDSKKNSIDRIPILGENKDKPVNVERIQFEDDESVEISNIIERLIDNKKLTDEQKLISTVAVISQVPKVFDVEHGELEHEVMELNQKDPRYKLAVTLNNIVNEKNFDDFHLMDMMKKMPIQADFSINHQAAVLYKILEMTEYIKELTSKEKRILEQLVLYKIDHLQNLETIEKSKSTASSNNENYLNFLFEKKRFKLSQKEIPKKPSKTLKKFKHIHFPRSLNDIQKVAFGRMMLVKKELSDKYYCFTHGVSVEIAFLHDLFTALDAPVKDVPHDIKTLTHKRFRVPNTTFRFDNTKSFLRSDKCPSKKNGFKDNSVRESILSCDGYHNSTRPYESTLHFFTQNKNIISLKKDWIEKIQEPFINYEVFERNPFFKNLIGLSINNNLDKVKELSIKCGRMYLIAIGKQIIENENKNYVWLSHAFGYPCTCITPNHKAFVNILRQHNAGKKILCNSKSENKNFTGQYRILTHNLDNDKTKKVYSFDIMSEAEKKEYNDAVLSVSKYIKTCVQLDSISDETTEEELVSILRRLDLSEKNPDYIEGVCHALKEKSNFIKKHKNYLVYNLPEEYLK